MIDICMTIGIWLVSFLAVKCFWDETLAYSKTEYSPAKFFKTDYANHDTLYSVCVTEDWVIWGIKRQIKYWICSRTSKTGVENYFLSSSLVSHKFKSENEAREITKILMDDIEEERNSKKVVLFKEIESDTL